MSLAKHSYIHLRDGKLIGDTSAPDVDATLDAYAAANAPAGLALHFHGGVVSKSEGLKTAERLDALYREAGAFPVFFVWESGLIETVRNNLGQISGERIFRWFVRRGAEFVLAQLGRLAGPATRGAPPEAGKLSKDEVHESVESWFEGDGEAELAIPFQDLAPALSEIPEPEVDAIQRRIEAKVTADNELRTALVELRSGRASPTRSATRGAVTPQKPTLMTPEGLNKLFAPQPHERGTLAGPEGPVPAEQATRGVGMTALGYSAVQMALIVYRTVQRLRSRRDHGIFATVIEEVLRSFFLANVGQTLWSQMKKDTADAFGGDPDLHGGTALLSRLAGRLEQGLAIPRITLIGHSTGAVYICNFLKAADSLLPAEISFDVVFLAPAVTCKVFGRTLSEFGHRIRGFRNFAMSDDLECLDPIPGISKRIYPHSLLYFVSGLLEDEPDEPLVGMQRFFSEDAPFSEADHPEVVQVRKYLATTGRCIWSVANDTDGLRCGANAHVAFDDEEQTLASLRWILEHGM